MVIFSDYMAKQFDTGSLSSGQADYLSTRPELNEILPRWGRIRDCIDGHYAIKAGETTYLAMPDPSNQSEKNLENYRSYLNRAVFFNATGQTQDVLTNQIFYRAPVIEVPKDPSYQQLVINVDGTRTSIVQQARDVVRDTIGYGRAGLLTDYPFNPDGSAIPIQKEQLGDIRPTITNYRPWQIRNWLTQQFGAIHVLTSLILEEEYMLPQEMPFAHISAKQYRVYELIGGVVYGSIYRESVQSYEQTVNRVLLRNRNGDPLRSIPFCWVGSDRNNEHMDKPPLYDLSVLNLGHFVNSADCELSSFRVGNPQLVLTGLDEGWLNRNLEKSIKMGPDKALSLPVNADAKLIAGDPNMLPKDLMDQKEMQMQAMNAKFVEKRAVQRTATEADIDVSSENSLLGAISRNVSQAYKKALVEHVGEFLGRDIKKLEEEIKFELNTDFTLGDITPAERQQLVLEVKEGIVSRSEARAILRKSGIVFMEDKEALEEIKRDQAELQEREMQLMEKQASLRNTAMSSTEGRQRNNPRTR